jgi:hypothetical protein
MHEPPVVVKIVGQRRVQPAREELRRQRWTIARAAKEMAVPVSHLHCAVHGTARPSERLREQLPKLLGLPLERLFEPRQIVLEWQGHRVGNTKRLPS